jgi:hypothetical protein
MQSDNRLLFGFALTEAEDAVLCVDGVPLKITNILEPGPASIGEEDCTFPVGALSGFDQTRHLFGEGGVIHGVFGAETAPLANSSDD